MTMTSDYFEVRKTYLDRLKQMREREEKHLSAVDFDLFSSRFDRLIATVKSEIDEFEISQASRCRVLVNRNSVPCGGSVYRAGLLTSQMLYVSIFGSNEKADPPGSAADNATALKLINLQSTIYEPGRTFSANFLVRNDSQTFPKSPDLGAATIAHSA